MSFKTAPLLPEALYTVCDPAQFTFRTTADLEPTDKIHGQPRAVEAVRFAIGMHSEGYNLFAAGPEGVGRFAVVDRFLRETAAKEAVPDDWCYVNNFAEAHKPVALRLPPGRGCVLRADMAHLIDDLRAAVPAAFETDEYRNRRSVIEEGLKELHEEHFSALQEEAKGRDVTLIQTPMGLAVAPTKDGEVIAPKDFEGLPEEEKERRKTAMEDIQKKLEETLRQMPKWEREGRAKLRELNQEVTRYAVGFPIEELKRRWQDVPTVLAYLETVRTDVIDSVEGFLPRPPQAAEGGGEAATPGEKTTANEALFRRYRVNVMVDNSGPEPAGGAAESCVGAPDSGAPVVYEDHPTQPNLCGRIEHLAQYGTLLTDFNLIKPGALHRANGGYLILDARKVLMQPYAWETLMRSLRAESIRIESPAEAMGWATTITLEPEPIPLKVKVVLIGEPQIYYLLSQADPDFRQMFKVTADFDTEMARTTESALHYANLIATVTRRENLRPFDGDAVARVVEHGGRMVEDSAKLSTHVGTIADLVRESDYWAGQDGASPVARIHVQRAIDAKIFRSDRLRERIQEEILRQTLVVETEGEKVGQINGLSVLMLDSFAFGRPSRITCRTRIGRGEVIDIEREVALGGPLHSKGVLILSSFLSGRFAREQPLSLSASLVFEQSYGGVDGDSASSAELYALLSALSDIPIKQSFAVTGSVDQNGTVQAIGGVNEKIEGYFDICSKRGLTREQGVLIPASNVKHLMLRADVVEAVRQGLFRIFPVETVDHGIEILTGVEAGAPDAEGRYPIGSINRAVASSLRDYARKARAYAIEATRNLGRRGGPEERRR